MTPDISPAIQAFAILPRRLTEAGEAGEAGEDGKQISPLKVDDTISVVDTGVLVT
jgi:hypothetical protein